VGFLLTADLVGFTFSSKVVFVFVVVVTFVVVDPKKNLPSLCLSEIYIKTK
jgi:hypothetical protein